MVSVSERVEAGKLRLFKWKENLFNETVPSNYGFIMFLIALEIITVRFSDENSQSQQSSIREKITKLNAFASGLLSQDYIDYLLRSALSNAQFFLDYTIDSLTRQISNYIIVNFSFIDTELSLGTQKSRIVIVVDLNVERTLRYIDGEEDNEVRGGDHDDNDTTTDCFEGESDEEINQVDKEVRDIARELMPFFMQMPEALVADKPKLSVHFTDFKEIESPIKIQVYDGRQEEIICSICGDLFVIGSVVAKLPCLHVFHRDCIYTRLTNLNSCQTCGSDCAAVV